MPQQVLELAEAVHHALRVERLLLLHALVHLDAHALEELVHLPVYLLVGLHRLAGTLGVGALLKDCFELLHALGVYYGQCLLHDELEAVPLLLQLP